ncbi:MULTISPECIES: hypothetical protein [Clostridium]|uniref:hypothetical protein n=1 Tax=Clostridium TaxID=1485 RepID=UPI0008263331|nr:MULTISPECIES: hypothetical protein [Clostridium]PJI09242.1 hypothetical protein CUB90_15765 [Clostridium sp. CT7]
MKFNKKFKKITVSIISFLILVGIVTTKTYASNPFMPSPEIDGWQNKNAPNVNGSAVEHNGLRIRNTVWCKPGDVLGVTAWGKVRWKQSGDWDNTISNSYLTLDGTDNFSKWYIYGKEPRNLDSNRAELVADNSTDDVIPVDAEIGHSSANASDGCWHCGNLFWLKFNDNNNDRTYYPRCNFVTFNGNWLADEHNVSSWPQSIETIKTDGKAPIVTIDPICHSWTNQSINIGVNILDSGCGVQKYRYSICKNGIWQDYDWIYAKDHSDLSNAKFVKSASNAPEQISSSENNINNSITLSGQGIYQVKVQAVDNLGNTSDWQTSQNYCIDTTPPTGIYTHKSISSNSATLNFKPYDEGGSGVLLWRYRLSQDNGTTWGDWSNTIDGDAAKDISLENSGKYKIQSEITDKAGNMSDIYSETYNLEDSITVKASVAPNPAKQGQQITFNINTTGNAKYLTIYMPVEITSVDTSGTIFPINKTIKEEQNHSEKIQYVIPLKAQQSMRKNDGRIREPYKVIIIAKKQDGKTAKTSVDLDISGNVLDRIKTEIIGTGYDKGK